MRLELIHPMIVHFPIALLSTGVIVRFVALCTGKKTKYSFLRPAAWLILALGILTAWLAVIAGGIAADIVAPTLDNLETLKAHAEHARRAAFGFTIGLFIDLLKSFIELRWKQNRWFFRKGLTLIFCALYLVSLGNLIITGAYGAALVYEEGAAVRK